VDSLTIRETFLAFFEERGHRRFPSASLIPADPSVLLTIAGMLPFKPWFMGDEPAPVPRAVSFQKCVRTNDIENVGLTTRHLSFFEMLGNFSFGDYFKRDAMRWAWELSTEHFGLDPERIWVTIFEDDDEAEELWLTETDLPASRLQRLGAADNYWWTHAAGPGGPNSELYYDRGEAYGEAGGPAVNDERYLEFYNLVFMQHALDAQGTILGDLPAQNVDTGLGLERMAVLLQGVDNVFETDLFQPLLARAGELTGHTYGRDAKADVSLRVIAEHARTAAFLVGDGVLPSKEGRGYVLRRLMRRAIRHAGLLGADVGGAARIALPMVETVIDTMAPSYPDLAAQRTLITRVLEAEERDFGARLRDGLDRVEAAVAELPKGESFRGDVAFELHDTFGFPIDLTAEIVADAGLGLDRDAFDALMTEQRERARAGARKGGGGVPDDVYRQGAAAAGSGTVEFVGYDTLEVETSLRALLAPGGLLASASEGDEVEVILARSPFYAEGGGQVGDAGIIETPTGRLEVLDTQDVIGGGLRIHRARVVSGEVVAGVDVSARVDAERRAATGRSHSATHVLHATIKQLVGDHAQQAGSLVQPGRLRFDFPHFSALDADTVRAVEQLVNARVLADPTVRVDVMALEDAKRAGAVANFGDKYGQTVRVVSIGDFSMELCGGTHVASGAGIGTVTIVREESVGSNTRRIEALTGTDAIAYLTRERLVAEEIARLVDVPTGDAVARVQDLVGRLRAAEKELARLRTADLAGRARRLADAAAREGGVAIVVERADGLAPDDLRTLAAEIRGALGTGAIVIVGAANDGKAQLIGTVSDDLVGRGVSARSVLADAAKAVGGGAGGGDDLAQAGGRDASRIDEALGIAAAAARAAAGN
jgi:alanyl-tRNA synthetase